MGMLGGRETREMWVLWEVERLLGAFKGVLLLLAVEEGYMEQVVEGRILLG